METKKHMKKSGYAKGQPSGARGKPQKAKGDGAGIRPNAEKSMKGQPPKNPVKKAVPFKRSDKGSK